MIPVVPAVASGARRRGVGRTFYIDPAGSDANSGTSAVSPWQTVAKVNSTTLLPGDTVRFKRGGNWREQLTISQSGSDGLPITFSAYDSGNKPRLNGSNIYSSWTNAGGGIHTTTVPSQPGVVLENGVPMKHYKWNTDAPTTLSTAVVPSFAYDPAAGTKTVYIKNPTGGSTAGNTYEVAQRLYAAEGNGKNYLVFEDMDFYGWARHGFFLVNCNDVLVKNMLVNPGGGIWEAANTYLGNGIEFSGSCSRCTIDSCTVDGAYDSGMTLQTWSGASGPSTDFQILNSTATNCGVAGVEIALYDTISTLSNVTISGTTVTNSQKGWTPGDGPPEGVGIYFYTYGSSGSNKSTISGASVVNCTISGCANNAIWCENNTGHVVVDNCTITGNDGYGVYEKEWEALWAGSLTVKNSVIANNGGGGIHHASWLIGLFLDNNTIYSNGNSANGTYNVRIADYVSSILMTDNIFYGVNSPAFFFNSDQWTGPDSHHNCFYRSTVPLIQDSVAHDTLADYQSARGTEANSIEADPLFVNAGSGNFNLQAGSPCLGTGTSGANIGAK